MGKKVSVIIPTYNEQPFIAKCLDSLLANDYPKDQLEILLLDGRSEDGTFEIIQRYERDHECVRALVNPDRIQVKALNMGLQQARGEFILRCDAHCQYPLNYISALVRYLEEGKADNVGGAIETLPSGDSPSAKAVALALNHPFGVGLSFRTRKMGTNPVVVDTVPFGAWKRETFDRIGFFDENFVRAQDLELNMRLKKAGGKIVLLPALVTKYFARSTLRKLSRLAFQMGYAKAQILKKHRILGSYRQLFPVAFVLGIPLMIVIRPLALLYVLYIVAAACIAGAAAIKHRSPVVGQVMFAAFITMHTLYGVGYIKGLFDNFFLKRGRTEWEATR